MLRKIFALPDLTISSISQNENKIVISCRHKTKRSKCPLCGRFSKKIHSRYERNIKDLPACTHKVFISLTVRRFFCANKKCEGKIFSEQSSYIGKHSRFTQRAQEFLIKMFAETSANKAAYLSKIAGLSVSPSTCVRKIMNESIPPVNSTVTAIDIDDWAFRKGGNYGTIIVDLTTGKVIDLIKSRDEEDVKHWLEMHPHVELITRDRYAVYRNAATKALPDASK